MTGGNQLKLSAIICGTPLADALVDGARTAASSWRARPPGPASSPATWWPSAAPGSTPKQRMTQVAAGLGLLESTVIDQHFDQRNRYGRLLMIVAQSPQLLGMGVDEDTAAVVEDVDGHDVLRVVGRGAVTIFDPSRIVTNAYEAQPLLAAAGQRGGAARAAPRRPLRPHQPHAGPRDRHDRRPRRGRARWPRPATTCATWPATSPPPTPPPARCAGASPARGAAPRSEPVPAAACPRPGRSPRMSERPQPDLTIVETRVYRGANVWSYDKAIHLVVDLGALEKFPTNTIPGFTDNLLQMLPGLREHSCSRGRRGGFVERLIEGTWLGHVAEHCALALQQVVGHDIRRGKTRQVKGSPGLYNVDLRLRRRAGRPRRRTARRTPGQPPRRRPTRSSTGTPSSRTSSCAPSAPRSAPRPRRSSTRPSPATSPGSGSTSTRWSSSARASTPSGSGPR